MFFVFFLSGIMHIASDLGKNVPLRQSGALRFFCTNALGVIFEDGAQEIFRRLNGGKDSGRLWSRVLGYVWVVVFLSWSTACWQYPYSRIMRWEDKILAPDALRSLLGFPKR